MENKKQYSQKEISQILNKASELQAQRDFSGDHEGLNKEDLLHIAQEVGIDEEVLNQALELYTLPELASRFSWLKGTSNIQDISVVDGEITEDKWEEIVQEIRRITGGIGETGKTGSSFEWEQRLKEIGYTHISITPKDGSTRIQFVKSWKGLKFLVNFFSFLVPFMVTAISLDGAALNEILSFMTATVGGLTGIGFARIFLKSHYESQKKNMQNMFKGIASRMGNNTNQPRISIDDEEDTVNLKSSSKPSKTRS